MPRRAAANDLRHLPYIGNHRDCRNFPRLHMTAECCFLASVVPADLQLTLNLLTHSGARGLRFTHANFRGRPPTYRVLPNSVRELANMVWVYRKIFFPAMK